MYEFHHAGGIGHRIRAHHPERGFVLFVQPNFDGTKAPASLERLRNDAEQWAAENGVARVELAQGIPRDPSRLTAAAFTRLQDRKSCRYGRASRKAGLLPAGSFCTPGRNSPSRMTFRRLRNAARRRASIR